MRRESPPLPALYDLETDIGENHNVIDKHPDVAKRLKELLDRKREDFKRNATAGRARPPADRNDEEVGTAA